MSELEQVLRAAQVDWPATPDIARAVLARIEGETAAGGARREPAGVRREPAGVWRERAGVWRIRPWLTAHPALATVLIGLIALAAALAVPPARSAIEKALGIGGAEIVHRAPTATPAPTPPASAPLGTGLDLGDPVSEAQARRQAAFTPAPPAAGVGRPDAVWFAGSPPDGGRVSYVYRRPRVLVQEMRASVNPFIQKAAGPNTKVERIVVDGARGFYLAGQAHGFAYGYRDGRQVIFEPQRLAGPTLLLERGGLLLRVEGRIPKARAIRIVRSISATFAHHAG